MFAIEADLSVGRSVWSAPSFLETLISEEPRQPNSNVLLIRPKLISIRTDGYSAGFDKEWECSRLRSTHNRKKLKKKPFIPTYIRQQVKPGYRKSDSPLVDTSVMIIPQLKLCIVVALEFEKNSWRELFDESKMQVDMRDVGREE